MRKDRFFLIIPLLLLSILASGCGLINPAAPTPSDDEMATRVAQILTAMPTSTSAAEDKPVPTNELPTIAPTQPRVVTATPLPATETAIPEAATATPAAATATPTAQLTLVPSFTPPASDPRAKLGSPNWTDTMDKDTYWPTGEDKYTAVKFESGVMKFTGLTTTDGWRLASTKQLSNFYLEMKATTATCSGSDRYGMFVRVPVVTEADRGYLFGITCDGQYSLRKWDGKAGDKGVMTVLVNWTASPSIQAGSNKTNTIGFMAVGDRLILYANGALLKEVKDSAYGSGSFGVFVGARETTNFTVSVDEINYWENPTP